MSTRPLVGARMAAENTSLRSEIELLRKRAVDAKDCENYRLALNKMIDYLDLKFREDDKAFAKGNKK